jgi:hypothetical protein
MFRWQRQAKKLAARGGIGCNARSFHFPEKYPMHVKRRRRLINFESCSVALFASLALSGSAFAARGQTAGPTTRPFSTSSVPSMVTVPQALPAMPRKR